MAEQLTPKPEPTPKQQTLIDAYLSVIYDNPANQEHKKIIREHLLRDGIDPEDFRPAEMSDMTEEQKIKAIKQKYAILREAKTNPGYQQDLNEQERLELAPFLRLDEKA